MCGRSRSSMSRLGESKGEPSFADDLRCQHFDATQVVQAHHRSTIVAPAHRTSDCNPASTASKSRN